MSRLPDERIGPELSSETRRLLREGSVQVRGLADASRILQEAALAGFEARYRGLNVGQPQASWTIEVTGHIDHVPPVTTSLRRWRILKRVVDERQRQDAKWGSPSALVAEARRLPSDWVAILAEEAGEFAEAVLHDRFGGPAAANLDLEAVQVAAVAVSFLEWYDVLMAVSDELPGGTSATLAATEPSPEAGEEHRLEDDEPLLTAVYTDCHGDEHEVDVIAGRRGTHYIIDIRPEDRGVLVAMDVDGREWWDGHRLLVHKNALRFPWQEEDDDG